MVSTSTELFNCFFHYYYVLDPELLIAGMIPSSKAQQDAVFWLSDYFNTFGDSYSNSALTHISVGTRAELYRDYCQDQARHDLEIVNEQKFLLLWRTLFPYVVLRDFVGIFYPFLSHFKVNCLWSFFTHFKVIYLCVFNQVI